MSWPPGIPRTLGPEQRVERARKAATDRASADGLIKSLSKKTLTGEQRAKLVRLLLDAVTDTAAAS